MEGKWYKGGQKEEKLNSMEIGGNRWMYVKFKE